MSNTTRVRVSVFDRERGTHLFEQDTQKIDIAFLSKNLKVLGI